MKIEERIELFEESLNDLIERFRKEHSIRVSINPKGIEMYEEVITERLIIKEGKKIISDSKEIYPEKVVDDICNEVKDKTEKKSMMSIFKRKK